MGYTPVVVKEEDATVELEPWPKRLNMDSVIVLPDADLVLNKFLRCTSCLKYELTPASLCKKGHPICPLCFADEELTFCTYVDENERSCHARFLMNLPMGIYHYLHDNSTFFCPNRSLGCHAELLGLAVKDHVDFECHFRNLPRCVFSNCHTMAGADLSDYDTHLVADHEVEVSFAPMARVSVKFDEAQFNSKKKTMSPLVVSCFDAKFMVIMKMFNNRIAMWASVIRQPVGKHFKATFILPYNEKTKNGRNVLRDEKVFFHEVHVPNLSVDNIIEMCECFDMTKSAIEAKFLKTDAESGHRIWNFEVLIEPI